MNRDSMSWETPKKYLLERVSSAIITNYHTAHYYNTTHTPHTPHTHTHTTHTHTHRETHTERAHAQGQYTIGV